MKDFLNAWKKQIEIAVLIALVLAIDFLKIADAPLKYMLMGLVGSLTGWHGLNTLLDKGSSSSPPAAPPSQLPTQ